MRPWYLSTMSMMQTKDDFVNYYLSTFTDTGASYALVVTASPTSSAVSVTAKLRCRLFRCKKSSWIPTPASATSEILCR